MKIYLAMISAAALALAACSQEAAKPAEPAPASEAAVSAPVQAASEAAPAAQEQTQQPAASVETPAPQASAEDKPTEEAKPAAEDKPAETAADGKKVFDGLCFGCHAANSAIPDSPRITNKADWAPRIKKGKDTLFKHALEGFTDKGMMPARGGNSALSDDEVKAAVVYMVNESGGKF